MVEVLFKDRDDLLYFFNSHVVVSHEADPLLEILLDSYFDVVVFEESLHFFEIYFLLETALHHVDLHLVHFHVDVLFVLSESM